MPLSKEELDVYVELVAAAVMAGQVSNEYVNMLTDGINIHRRNQRAIKTAKATAEGNRCTPNSRVVLHDLSPQCFNGIECILKVITDGKALVVFDEPIERGVGGKKRLIRRVTVPVQCIKRA
jgi:hypothetical protein